MQRHISLLIWIFTFLIVAAGLVALYSASYHNPRVSERIFYDQLWIALIGFGLMFYVSRIDYHKWYDAAYFLYGLMLFLLVLVLISGRHALGAQRWLTIAGISFQPSEFAKLFFILALARYFSGCRSAISFRYLSFSQSLWRHLIFPLLMTLLPMFLIFKQPDLGTALLFFGIFGVMLFISGLEYRYVFSMLLLCLLSAPLGWFVLKPYQKDRLLVFMNPNIDPLGAGYTIIQAKIAIGSGRLFGKGWLAGTQNQLNFLPERHTDFIFSVIGEEWGLLGTVFLLLCFFVIVFCGLRIAEQVKDRFGMQLCIGIITIFTLQFVINMGMVMGLCPVVGLTLPLVSYGRSSFLISIIMMGMLLSLSRKRRVF